MKKITILVLLLLMIAISCKKKQDPEPDLPPETQEGKNTFGCMLNGKLWRNTADQPGFPALYAQVQGGGWVDIYAWNRNGSDVSEYVSFVCDSLNQEGIYNLKNIINKASANYVNVKQNIHVSTANTSLIQNEGVLTITKYDKIRKIIAGRFWFKVQKQGGILYDVSDGRFDISF